MPLLSLSSTKIDKSDKFSNEFISKILYLAPYKLSGYNTCPAASNGCAAACLNTAGMGFYTNVQNARIRKTKYFFENRPAFLKELSWEIYVNNQKAKKNGKKLAVRLNGTSDISWENFHIFEQFPDVQFYDYTKVFHRAVKFLDGNMPENYHLTFSLTENNLEKATKILEKGGNVAAVFQSNEPKKTRELPGRFLQFPVINGETHDLRFLDRAGSWVGLWAKGRARKEQLDFTISC